MFKKLHLKVKLLAERTALQLMDKEALLMKLWFYEIFLQQTSLEIVAEFSNSNVATKRYDNATCNGPFSLTSAAGLLINVY